MTCEEFEMKGLGLEREARRLAETTSVEYAAVEEHLRACSRCAALQESWHGTQYGLRALGAATRHAQSPARLEMRLRQEFRRKYRAGKSRAVAIFASWALASAAVLVGAISWWNWHNAKQQGFRADASDATQVLNSKGSADPLQGEDTQSNSSGATMIADSEAGDFTLLPGSLPQETDDAAIVRVRLQRGALRAFGLPVNQESAGDWLQVEFLVGEDGQPRALRLPSGTSR